MTSPTVEERIEAMEPNPLGPDSDPLWRDLADFEELKSLLHATRDSRRQLACYTALAALARSTGDPDVTQFLVDQLGVGKKKGLQQTLMMKIRFLRGIRDAGPILALVRDAKLGYTAMACLGASVDPRAEPALIEALAEGGRLQFAAAEALASVGTRAAAPALVEVIRTSSSPPLRRAALAALRTIDAAGHIDLFVEIYTRERTAEVRWHCLVAIRDHAGEDAVAPVVEHLESLLVTEGRREEYSGGPLLAPRDIVHVNHRAREEYATAFTLGVDFLRRVGGAAAARFLESLGERRHQLLESEREFLAARGRGRDEPSPT